MASEYRAQLLASMFAIVQGYRRHAGVMAAVRDEQKSVLAAGYTDPLDGFPSTAASIAESWRDRVVNDVTKGDDVDLISTLVSTVRETGRYYSEADLTWSKVWAAYAPEHADWIKNVRSTAMSAGEHRTEFAAVLVALKDRIE